ncbi:MAG: hypothetical protein IJ374_03475 [Lachnospiraceae bacterium]|nr:hypothetical protein [Lachnospiraceae bacterium]
MKNNQLIRYIYKMMVYTMLVVSIVALSGCGKEDTKDAAIVPVETKAYQVVTEIDEKYVCAMYPLGTDEIETTTGKIQSLEDESKVFTAEYIENLASFCFLVDESGTYKVSIVRGETVLSEHVVDINDESGYYLLYMPGIETK